MAFLLSLISFTLSTLRKNQCLVKTVRNLFTIFRDSYNMSCCLMEDIPLISVQKCCFAWMDINFLKIKMALIRVCPTLFIFSPVENIRCTASHFPFRSFPSYHFHFYPTIFFSLLFHIYINIFGFSVRKATFPKAELRSSGKWWRRKKLLFLQLRKVVIHFGVFSVSKNSS